MCVSWFSDLPLLVSMMCGGGVGVVVGGWALVKRDQIIALPLTAS